MGREQVTSAGTFVTVCLPARSIRFEYWPSLVHAAGGLAVFVTGICCGVLHYYGAPPGLLSFRSPQFLQSRYKACLGPTLQGWETLKGAEGADVCMPDVAIVGERPGF